MAAPTLSYVIAGIKPECLSIHQNFRDLLLSMTDGTKDFTIGSLTTTGIVATTTNDSAISGRVGQSFSASTDQGSPISLTTTTQANITSLPLDGGDYLVSGAIGYNIAATTTINTLAQSISTTSATLPARTSEARGNANQIRFDVNYPASYVPRGNIDFGFSAYRISLATTTTLYLVAFADFGVSTCSGYGSIVAWRIR